MITAHNQWLSQTRSIPYWTTSVFCSTVTDLVLIYESAISPVSAVRWLTFHSWTLNFWILLRLNQVKVTLRLVAYGQSVRLGVKPSTPAFTYGLARISGKCLFLARIRGNLCWFRWHRKRDRYQVDLHESAISKKRVLASCWLAVDYSSFQASCHNIY
jgi:hypothetical protein